MVVLSRNHALNIIDNESLVWGAKENDTIGSLMQSRNCRMIEFAGLYCFHEALRNSAFFRASQPSQHQTYMSQYNSPKAMRDKKQRSLPELTETFISKPADHI